MEIVIVILALVYSVWSEIQKKKQEEDVNINFELTSLDDFFNKPGASGSSGDGAYRPGQKKANKKREKAAPVNFDNRPGLTSRPENIKARNEMGVEGMPTMESRSFQQSTESAAVNYDNLPGLTSRGGRKDSPRVEVNYDDLPALTGRTNYEDDVADGALKNTDSAQCTSHAQVQPVSGRFSLTREDLVKTIVMTEVLQRYNINRIYDRIPGNRSEN